MIKIVAENFVKPECKKEFMENVVGLIQETRKEAGCLSYHLHTDLKDEYHLTFIEEWKDMSAIQAHNNSVHFQKYIPILAEFCEKPGTCYLYSEIDL